MSVMKALSDYDSKREKYITILEKENAQLKKQVSEAVNLAFDGAIASDRMKLDLIMSGCLSKPKEKLTLTEREKSLLNEFVGEKEHNTAEYKDMRELVRKLYTFITT